eukprot:6735210-Prorocentrum_lima.AAC.1
MNHFRDDKHVGPHVLHTEAERDELRRGTLLYELLVEFDIQLTSTFDCKGDIHTRTPWHQGKRKQIDYI